MIGRREFIATGIAAAVGTPALARVNADATMPVYDLPEALQPRRVKLKTKLPAGQVHVDPTSFALYWTLEEGEAIRWTVGIGRPGLYEPGTYYVGRKAKWPFWTPTPDMIKRNPAAYEKHADGMEGGVGNPLGARALYLYTPERGDTLLRIHGTNKPNTLGKAVSNGCARMINQQIIPFFDMVPTGTVVVLHPHPTPGVKPALPQYGPKNPVDALMRRFGG
ncbi:MAG: L,D-transpeptidase [Mangrovicoccus sp.]|nr:L,D-transpeptidase [Mangrovicoccus sp.]